MKLVRESLFEEEEYKPKWIKGPTKEKVRARLEPKLKGMTLEEKFKLAVINGVAWLVQECIDAGYDPSAYINWAIRSASCNGHLEVVKALLADKRVDPSARDNWAMRFASYYGHLEVVKVLLADKRVDPSASDNLAIYCASRHGNLEIVKELLKDKRVRDKLSPELKIKFKEYLK